MNKKLFLFLLLSFFFIPKSVFAISPSDIGTQTFTDDFTSWLNQYFNYDNVFYSVPNSSFTDSTTIQFCLIKNDNKLRINSSNVFVTKTNRNNTDTGATCYTTQLRYEGYFHNFNAFSIPNQTSYNSSRINYSTIDIYDDTESNIIVAKNMNYSPPQPEVCDECQECEEGSMEVTNFPITKEEFYVLLIALCVLIFMLFFKWCFPMKGGKK